MINTYEQSPRYYTRGEDIERAEEILKVNEDDTRPDETNIETLILSAITYKIDNYDDQEHIIDNIKNHLERIKNQPLKSYNRNVEEIDYFILILKAIAAVNSRSYKQVTDEQKNWVASFTPETEGDFALDDYYRTILISPHIDPDLTETATKKFSNTYSILIDQIIRLSG